MATTYLKEFDDLLEQIINRYKGLDPAPDSTIGSPVFIKASMLASMLWGLYKLQDYIAQQIFLDQCDADSINHYGSIYGVVRLINETDEDYRTRLLNFLRQPPAGGNKLDFETWSKTPTIVYGGVTYYVASATVNVPPAVSPGSVVITIIPDDETILASPLASPMSDLTTAVQTYVDSVRPVTASSCTVQAAIVVYVSVTLTATILSTTDSAAYTTACEQDLTLFLNNLKAGDAVYSSKVISVAISDGAINVTNLFINGIGYNSLPSVMNTVYRAGAVYVSTVSA